MASCDPICAASCSTPARPTTTSPAPRPRAGCRCSRSIGSSTPGRADATTSPQVAALAGVDEDRLRRLVARGRVPRRARRVSRCSPTPTSRPRGSCCNGAFARRSDFATVLRHVRVISSSMARVASVLAEYYGDDGLETARRRASTTRRSRGRSSRTSTATSWPRSSCTRPGSSSAPRSGAVCARDAAPDLAVAIGFADLAGYTRAQRRARPRRASPSSSAGGRSSRTTRSREHGGRVVKTIGDEVMFVGPVRRRSRASRSRSATRPRGRGLPPVRVGDRGRDGGRARRRLLRTGREPREPAHRDRARRARSTPRPRCTPSWPATRRSTWSALRDARPAQHRPGRGVLPARRIRDLGLKRRRVACSACRIPTDSVCSRCTRTPTTKRRRARAPRPSTRPRACTTCSCAAPAARPATS